MHIGPYEVIAIETGGFALDGGAMFGIVPRPLWEKKIPVDARNRIDMRLRCLLLRGEVAGKARTILIDTGMGDKWDAKGIEIYRIDYHTGTLLHNLAEHGVTPSDVTDVILTHLHFDHAGGATSRNPQGQVTPTFPRATYYVQQAHYAWAQHPTDKDGGSFMPNDYEPLIAAQQLTFLDGEVELFPGIRMRLSNGHTTALQHPIISDGTNTLFYCADLIPTSLHLHLPWIMAYDIRPLSTLDEKKTLLAEAVRDHWTLVFEHCPLVKACTVAHTDRGYQLKAAVDV